MPESKRENRTGGFRPEAVFRIRGNKIFWGPGLMELMRRIDETGSIRSAAAEMFMSYAKARRLIALAEAELGFRIINTRKGGTSHGGASLSEKGKCYLLCCSAIQNAVQDYCEEQYNLFFGDESSHSIP